MSAERNLSPQDYDLLSAYIDGELTDAEQQTLEQRLSTDPLLQRELNSLRATVNLIQLVPEMTAPRNFTLTSEMVTPKNVVPLRPRRAPRSAYLSLVASVALMIFGALFMVSEIGQESATAGFESAPVQSAPPAESAEEIALLPTETTETLEQQAQRAMTEPLEDVDAMEAEEEAVAEDGGDLADTGVAESDLASDEDMPGGGAADGFNATTTLQSDDVVPPANLEVAGTGEIDGDVDSANDVIMSEVADAEMEDESLSFETYALEESDDIVSEEPEVLAGASAPEAMSQIVMPEVTAEIPDNEGTTELNIAEAEADTTADKIEPTSDVDGTEAVDRGDTPPPAPLNDPTGESTIGGLEVGIGLLIGGVLLLLLSFGLFRRNRG